MSLYQKGVPMARYRSKPAHTELINTPFSEEQVAAMNAWQESGLIHPYTCPKYHVGDSQRILISTPKGWVCSDNGCDYTQNWAHAFTAEPSVLQAMKDAASVRLTEGQWLARAQAEIKKPETRRPFAN